MQRLFIILLNTLFTSIIYGQNIIPHKLKPDSTSFSNVFVKKLGEDNNQSTYAIWVKNEVKPHYHANHTEYIQVVSGKGRMTLNNKTFDIKKGDAVLIPKDSVHSVITLSRKPLKVISVQSPIFNGDRIWVK